MNQILALDPKTWMHRVSCAFLVFSDLHLWLIFQLIGVRSARNNIFFKAQQHLIECSKLLRYIDCLNDADLISHSLVSCGFMFTFSRSTAEYVR